MKQSNAATKTKLNQNPTLDPTLPSHPGIESKQTKSRCVDWRGRRALAPARRYARGTGLARGAASHPASLHGLMAARAPRIPRHQHGTSLIGGAQAREGSRGSARCIIRCPTSGRRVGGPPRRRSGPGAPRLPPARRRRTSSAAVAGGRRGRSAARGAGGRRRRS